MALDSQDSNVSLPTIPFSSDDRRSQEYYSNSRVVRLKHDYGDDLSFEESRSYRLDWQQSRYAAAAIPGGTTTTELSIYLGLKTRFRALVRKIQNFRRRGSNDQVRPL